MKKVHINIKPISCFVKEEFFYNQEKGFGNLIPARIFSISSYEGEALSFQVLLSNGSVFSYIPIHALVHHKKRYRKHKTHFSMDELLYHNCHDTLICVHRFYALKGRVQAFFKTQNLWLSAKYLLTIDWYESNYLLHLLCLENGQFAALPSHKVLFHKKNRTLLPYKKLRQTWKVNE